MRILDNELQKGIFVHRDSSQLYSTDILTSIVQLRVWRCQSSGRTEMFLKHKEITHIMYTCENN